MQQFPQKPPAVRCLGGWAVRTFEWTTGREVSIWTPADPDAFLDDAEAVKDHGPSPERPDRSDIPFWQYLWPAAEIMARMVSAHDWLSETDDHPPRMLEIGAGLGPVGLAGLCAGCRVTFSDYQTPALEVAAANARGNGFCEDNFDTRLLDWTDPASDQYPIILGCEVIYERAIHEPILNILDHMLAPEGTAWLGDPGRSHLPHFIEKAKSRGYRVEIQDAEGQVVAEPRFGEFQLLVLRKR